jgi:hypothetical protein
LTLLLSLLSAQAQDVVLMGDDFVARHDLNRVLVDMLEATPVPVEVRGLAGEERTLAEHVSFMGDKPAYIDAFGATRSHVVLQEAVASLLDGDVTDSTTDAAFLGASAARVGASLLVMQPPALRDGDDGDFAATQDAVDVAVETLASGTEADVVPVGDAFRLAYEDALASTAPLEDSPFYALYERAGDRPSQQGTVLIASVLAATLTGRPVRSTLGLVPAEQEESLIRLAERVVFDDPHADGLSFAFDWADRPDPISGAFTRPWVRLSTDATTDALVIADRDGTVFGDGLLEVVEGGALDVRTLEVGAWGRGDLEVLGGTVVADDLILGKEADAVGRLRLDGGALQVRQLLPGLGEHLLALESGTLTVSEVIGLDLSTDAALVVGPGARTRGYVEALGGLTLHAEGRLLVESRLVVAGPIDIDWGATGEAGAPDVLELALARTVDLEDASFEIPGWDLGLDRATGTLFLERDPTEVGDPPEEVGEGCACGTRSPSTGWLVLLLSGMSLRRRDPSTA